MESFQPYFYVGPKEILERIDEKYEGTKIKKIEDVQVWVEAANQVISHGNLIATFIINEQKELIISDRHSEHVMCAGGKKVLAAGEITFNFEEKEIAVSAISNQSTGYCPKPDSWTIVALTLQQLNIAHPDYFTSAFEFRRCTHCQTKNLIKEAIYECAVCKADLDLNWNFGKESREARVESRE